MDTSWDGINRRRQVRAESLCTIHLYTTKGRPISTYTEDISVSGVRVVTQQSLNKNDILELKIYILDEFVRCKGKVAWIKEKDNPVLTGIKFFSVGIEFSGLTSPDRDTISRCIEMIEAKRKAKNSKGKK